MSGFWSSNIFFNIFELAQVVIRHIGNEDVLTASIFFKFLDEMSAQEAFSSGNGYSLGFQADHLWGLIVLSFSNVRSRPILYR